MVKRTYVPLAQALAYVAARDASILEWLAPRKVCRDGAELLDVVIAVDLWECSLSSESRREYSALFKRRKVRTGGIEGDWSLLRPALEDGVVSVRGELPDLPEHELAPSLSVEVASLLNAFPSVAGDHVSVVHAAAPLAEQRPARDKIEQAIKAVALELWENGRPPPGMPKKVSRAMICDRLGRKVSDRTFQRTKVY